LLHYQSRISEMFVENISYVLTFIITTGMAILGVLVSFNLFQSSKRQVFQILLYQQIFLFSFFLYGIWGNIAIQEIISDFNLNNELSRKLALFIPMLGTPFLIISWFMHMRFIFGLMGYKLIKSTAYIYFISFFIIIGALGFSVQNQLLDIPVQPDLFIVRSLLVVNLGVILVSLIPVLMPTKKRLLKQMAVFKKFYLLYVTGVLTYSILLFYFNSFGFFYTCISLIFLFAISVIFPVFFKTQPDILSNTKTNIGFREFCDLYDISKREAEIILEICTGKSNKAIAEKLFITLQTVKDHNHRIYTKTQVKSRVQLANLVREKTVIKDF